ncbi:MAG: hypothetical protein K8T89_07080 [Planctomycetes bacterium]|nr:hypothetical protein [Planctomycetota bacterium]
MNVDPNDGVCRTCGGPLQIIDFDDVTLTVACIECSDIYDVETDAFGDGCMTYHFPLMAERLFGGDDGPESHSA